MDFRGGCAKPIDGIPQSIIHCLLLNLLSRANTRRNIPLSLECEVSFVERTKRNLRAIRAETH